MKHEYLRIVQEEGLEEKITYQCLVYEKDPNDVLHDVAESIDLSSLKEWRYRYHPESQRVYSQRVNAIVDAWVGDNVYQDIVVLSEVDDVRAECGTPDDERPDWQGPGFIGLCLSEGECELVHAWSDVNHVKA